MGAEQVADLSQGQQATGAQAGEPVGQAIRAPQVDDDRGGEPRGDARLEAGRVEQLGRLRIGVLVEQAVELGDDRGIGPPQLGRRDGQRQAERPDRAAPEADLGDDLVRAQQGDVLDEEADHPLAFALRRRRIRPQAPEVGREREDPGSLGRIDERAIALAGPLVRLLRVGERAELRVPVGLEGVRDEAVVRIDPQVPALGELGLIAGPLDLHSAERIGLGGSGGELGLDLERRAERQRADRLDEQVADRPVDRCADDPGTAGLRMLDRLALALILGDRSATHHRIADAHPLPAAATDHQALEERGTLSGWTRPPLGTVGLGVLGEAAQVRPLAFQSFEWDPEKQGFHWDLNPGFLPAVQAWAKPGDTILVSCRSGGRSAMAINLLAKAGYTACWNIVDGMEGG